MCQMMRSAKNGGISMETKILEAILEIDAMIAKEKAEDHFYAAVCLEKAREIIMRKIGEALE